MNDHVTRRSSTPTWSGGRARLALAVLLGALGAGVVRAESATIDQAAEVVSTAERVATTGDGLLFPIEPTPICEVLNNYGGVSKSGQSGGHQGVDIGAMEGQAVYAVVDGVLESKLLEEDNPTAGNGWKLRGVDPVIGDAQYRYYHLADFADGLEEGSVVAKGQVIGWVGDTGNATPDGWHLHFEVRPGPALRYGSQPTVDPVPLLAIPSVCNVY